MCYVASKLNHKILKTDCQTSKKREPIHHNCKNLIKCTNKKKESKKKKLLPKPIKIQFICLRFY